MDFKGHAAIFILADLPGERAGRPASARNGHHGGRGGGRRRMAGAAGWDGRGSPRARPRGHTILRMTTATDYDDLLWMRRALDLARTVMYTTAPNPRVGCVIVRDGRVLGEGATQPPGGPHAEVCALRDAQARGETVAGATLYVTLEPCSHHGRTRPAWTPCWPPRRRAWWWRSATPIPWSTARAWRGCAPPASPSPPAFARGSAGAQRGLHLPHESRAALGLDEDGGFAGWPQRVA